MQAIVVKQLRRQHRHERQCDQARKRDGGSKGNAELVEYVADVARHEGDREYHRDQDERRGDDGKADLAAAVDGGQQRRLLALDAAHDVLEHDDCVVDDEADREHEAEQRQRVDRIAEARHDDKSRDDGYRDGDRRNDRCAHGADKGVDDGQHQCERYRQRLADFQQGGSYEHGGVDIDREFDIVGHRGLQLVEALRDVGIDLQQVCLRLWNDAESHASNAVGRRIRARVFRSEFDVGDLAEADQVVALTLLEHELLEIARRLETGIGSQRELARRRLEASRRDLHVLTAQRILDIRDGQFAGRKALRVDPDAHGRPPYAAVADPRHTVHG